MIVNESTVSSVGLLDATPNLFDTARERDLTAVELMRLRVWMGQLRARADRLPHDGALGPWHPLQDFDRNTAVGYARHVGDLLGCYYVLRTDEQGKELLVEVEGKIKRCGPGLLIPEPSRERTLDVVHGNSGNPEELVIVALMKFRPRMRLMTLCKLDSRSRAFRVVLDFVGSG